MFLCPHFLISRYMTLKENALTLENHIETKTIVKVALFIYVHLFLKSCSRTEFIGCVDFKIGSGEMTDIPTLIEY